MNMNLKVKLYLENDNEKFMGIGVLWLLQKVNETNSLRKAACELGISYSKAFNMIKNLEASLGNDVLERRRGGQKREGSVLTPFALEFAKLYDSFQSECKDLLDKPYKKFCASLEKISK